MEYTGLINKYKVNRPLTDEERRNRLDPAKRLEVEPNYYSATIRMNSRYLEVADKYYGWKGALTFVTVALLLVGVFTTWVSATIFLGGFAENVDDRTTHLVFGGVPLLMGIALVCALLWLLARECFRLTHYPIRLQRDQRMVHVFRLDGTVLSVPWDKVFFTLGRGNRAFGIQTWDVRGHVLADDRVTVVESFAFALSWPEIAGLHRYWEYVRRYMEDGPGAIVPYTLAYLPIAERRESWAFGLMRLALNLPGLTFVQVIMAPAFLLFSFGRWLAMRTCRIPVWPAHIEAACAIDAGDPFAKDARSNPSQLWKVM
ncbi:hypothetical protein LFL96_00265 [Paraburkholderia sp. D15]|uniref:DUF6708 domain-containing protein n=1 Tax=Paraburkholderia sp. D15 TaxID=2880218 RepID=UPI00247B2BB9|nr:DUF6708 domain-containing protein [Paraburkholderia sp. D15]WGS49986.1 hypothetical protein LFL96_00265 [Paraburkholderia sp. D15]WKF57901.1 hypothetical protein HUO10_002395 [Paraburkholderia busanensis]